MIYSIEELSKIHLYNLLITSPLYQEEYDYNINLNNIISFLEEMNELGIIKNVELYSSLEEDLIVESEVLEELKMKVINLKIDSLKIDTNKIVGEFDKTINYWKDLYLLEDKNNINIVF